MGQLAMMVVAALLMQAPALKAQSGGQASVQTGKSAAVQAGQQISPSAAPATSPATAEAPSETESTDRPMSSAEANATIDKLRETVRESIQNGRGSIQHMDPEAQKQFAETADKLLSDPAVRGAIARQIRDFRPPWQQGATFWLAGLLVPIAFFALIAVFFWLVFRSKQSKLQTQMAAQAQLISKFSSGAELATFLSSPAGMQLLHGMSSPQVNIKNRVPRHLSIGAVFGTVGLGALLVSRAAHGFFVVGVIFLFLGLGFLISAWLTSRLAEKMGPNVPTPNALPPTLPPQQ